LDQPGLRENREKWRLIPPITAMPRILQIQ